MLIRDYLDNILIKTFEKLGYDTSLAHVSFSDRTDIAHLQCNGAFGLAKTLHKNPFDLATEISEELKQQLPQFEISVVRPGFINFIIKSEFLAETAKKLIADKRFGLPYINKGEKVVFDYGGANIAKPLHVGHLRPAIIGEALNSLYKLLGFDTVSDVHLGDWGLQMGLTIAQLMDDYDMSGYFEEGKPKTPITLEMLDICYPKASARKKEDDEFNARASKITLELQNGHKAYREMWKQICDVSIVDCKKLYDELGAHFDLWLGESSVNELVPHIVEDLKQQGIAYKSEGALVVDVADDLPPAIILKSNGAQMYAITDIATIVDRVKKYKDLRRIIYLTDARQGLHFKQVFTVCRKANFVDDKFNLTHIGFGTINGKDGKPFKTRDGGTVKLRSLINMVEEKAHEKLLQNNANVDNTHRLASQVAMAAIKYGDLSNVVSKDYIFDVDKFTSFEGKTGPYIQYTGVRIKSLLNKANYVFSPKTFNVSINNAETQNIMLALFKYLDSFIQSYKDNSLNSLCLELYNLCSAFSTFYNNVKILIEPDKKLRESYLNLSQLVLKAINLGTDILGFVIPEQM